MATQSFKNLAEQTKQEPAAAPAAEPKQEPAEQPQAELPSAQPQTALAAPATAPVLPDVEGEVSQSDIKLPRINLVQKMSDLVNSGFRAGEIVYNKEVPLPLPVRCVVVRIKKQFQQDLPYGSDVLPHMCDTLQEVREAGGTLEWGAENKYSEIAHLQLLVAGPDELPIEYEDLFPYTAADNRWAPAMFTAAKSAYKSAAKPVLTAAFNTLRTGLHHGMWALHSEERKNAMGSWHVPVMKLTGRAPADLVEIIDQMKGGA